MSYQKFIGKKPKHSNFKEWAYKGEDFSFDSSLSPKYSGRFTTSFLIDNGLLARIIVASGPFQLKGSWHNLKNSVNVHVIENAYHISNDLKSTNDWRINVPDPKELCLVKARPFESIHPAFVMEYIQNDFFGLNEDKKSEILEIRDQMVDATEEHDFIPSSSARDLNNFLYNQAQDKVFLIGFGLWDKK